MFMFTEFICFNLAAYWKGACIQQRITQTYFLVCVIKCVPFRDYLRIIGNNKNPNSCVCCIQVNIKCNIVCILTVVAVLGA
jgi:hypothetical protein